MRNIILFLIGIILIVSAIFFGNKIADSKKKIRPIPAKVVKTVFTDTVQNGSVQIIIPANGTLLAKRRIELFSEVQGVFKSTGKLYRAGQIYSKDQILVKIDAAEYYATLQASKSNLYNAIAAIMPDLRLDFPEIFTKWQNYLNGFNLNKTTPLLPEMASDKENYFITGRGIVSNYYNVKTQEQRLSKYTIRAPFSGVLIESLVTEGSLVRNGQKLGAFIDTSIYEMEVSLGKQYASFLKLGEIVALQNIEGTQTYQGKVSRINGSIDATTQTITAFIEVKDSRLKEGMYLKAKLNAKKEENAIEISRSLITDNNEIFIVRDSVLDLLSTQPVFFSDTKVVLKQIPNGTVIVTKPVPGAYAGMMVKPYNKKNKTPNKNL